MRKFFGLGLACVAVAVFVVLVAVHGSSAQVKKGKSRPALTKQLMKGLVAANCGAAGKAIKDKPADDAAWEALALNVALVNEASYILMDDGRCPDKDWADAAKALGEGSAKLLEAVEKKDVAASQAAFDNMTKACGACHKAHKK